MVNDARLRRLDEQHQHENETARRRIDLAETAIAQYRSHVHRVQESFFELAAHHGVADDPAFRAELQRLSDDTDQKVHAVGRMIAELSEEYDATTRRQADERDLLLAQRETG